MDLKAIAGDVKEGVCRVADGYRDDPQLCASASLREASESSDSHAEAQSRRGEEFDLMDLKAITGDVVDAAVQIHKAIGPGLLESVYEQILEAELRRRGHRVERQKDISFDYNGIHFENAFRLDVLVDDSVILELKSTEKMAPVYAKQLKTYLALTGKTIGLVLNFGMATMKEGVCRVANGYRDDPQLCASASLRESSGLIGSHAEAQRRKKGF